MCDAVANSSSVFCNRIFAARIGLAGSRLFGAAVACVCLTQLDMVFFLGVSVHFCVKNIFLQKFAKKSIKREMT